MEYAQLNPNPQDIYGHVGAAGDLYQGDQQQSLRSRVQRLQQQQQQNQNEQYQQPLELQQHEQLQLQQLQQQQALEQAQWDGYQPPVTGAYDQPADLATYSPEGGFYIPNSGVNVPYTDAQSQFHESFYRNDGGSNGAFIATTDPSTTQPRAMVYEAQNSWSVGQMVPNTTIGVDNTLGLPTTTAAETFYSPLDPSFLDVDQYNHNDFLGDPTNHYTANPEFGRESLSPSRGVELFDAPVPDLPDAPRDRNSWLPRNRLEHTPESIKEWFASNYASKRNLPVTGSEMSEESGGILCKLCQPACLVDSLEYRLHREEIHGVDFQTGFRYWAPLEVKPIVGVVGSGYEGFCATCKNWIALDLLKLDFNWFQHASTCQDHTVWIDEKKPASPIERYTTSGSEDEGADVNAIKKEATQRMRAGDFLLPRPPFASNSNSNPSDEGSSDIWSSNSSHSVLTSNSNSNSSVNSAMSHHSLESRRKKVLRLRKRKGARSSNQGLRLYQCTFCMADFANFGDWRRHEEVIHLVLEKWVCAPEGQYKNGTQECVYCDEVHAEKSNIPNRCNASYCHGRGPSERIFARKDHLKQHLKRMHGITKWRPSFEAWAQKSKGPQKSRCGFCAATFEDWHHRMTHVAWEFKHGQKMSQWQGDWGLDNTWMHADGKLSNPILPADRADHISKTLKGAQALTPAHTEAQGKSLRAPDSGSKSAPPDAGHGHHSIRGGNSKRGLTRKPRLTSLRDGFSQQQEHQHLQQQGLFRQPMDQLPLRHQGDMYPQQDLCQQADVYPQGDIFQQQDMFSQGDMYQQHNMYSQLQQQQQQMLQHVKQEHDFSQPIQPQQQVLTPPFSWSHPSSAVSPPQTSPLAAYSNHNQPPIQPRPPEFPVSTPTAKVEAVAQKKTPSFQCPYCSTKLSRQDNLRRHVKTHFVRAT